MDEEISNTVNLDLNLGPDPEVGLEPAMNNASAELTDWANGLDSLRRFTSQDRSRFTQSDNLPVLAETHTPAIELSQLLLMNAAGHGSRFTQIDNLPVLAETHSPAIELSQLLLMNVANAAALRAGQGSIAGGEIVDEDSKKCEHGRKVMEEDNVTEEKKDVEKSVGSNGSFFDCYICLDLSKDPVVTNCGHLYCWSCLYNWLQVSEAKECPVCKGEVSVKTVTPIYGRGKNKRESEEVSSDTKIPSRPQARRMESLRATLHRSSYVPTEMIRHLQDRLERESSTGERRARTFLNRFMTSRGVRAEQNQSSEALIEPPDDINYSDFASNIAPEQALPVRRQVRTERAGRMLSFNLGSAERSADAYMLRTHALVRYLEQNNSPPLGGEDRDSFSSIVGVMNAESQVDTAAEIDSMLTVSSSSSVRRHENGSRVSDVDSADSPPLMRSSADSLPLRRSRRRRLI